MISALKYLHILRGGHIKAAKQLRYAEAEIDRLRERCRRADACIEAQNNLIESLKYPPGPLEDRIKEWEYWGSLGDEQEASHSRRGIKNKLRECVAALRQLINFQRENVDTPLWEVQTHVPRYCSSCGKRLICACEGKE